MRVFAFLNGLFDGIRPEIFIVAGIIALRAVLTLLIHWEIKNESGGTAGEPSEKSKK